MTLGDGLIVTGTIMVVVGIFASLGIWAGVTAVGVVTAFGGILLGRHEDGSGNKPT